MPTTRSLTIRTAERPGGDRPTEDRIFQTDNVIIVLDGATQAFTLERTGAWIAQETGQRLIAAFEREPNIELRALLRGVIQAMADDYDLVAGQSPSATVSITRFNAETIEVLVLCDSPVVILGTDGEITEVRDDRLARISDAFRRPPGLRDMTQPVWIEGMKRFETYRNQPGGFWCVSASPEAADHAIIREFDPEKTAALMMMTDGVSAGIDSYQTPPTWQEAFEIAKPDPNALINLVHETELTDPDANKWPRGKTHDDKALALVTVASADQ